MERPKFVWVRTGEGREVLVPADHPAAQEEAKCAVSVRRDTLTERERVSLSRLIGTPVSSASEARRLMKQKNLRFVDRGEKGDKMRRNLREWHESSRDPSRRGPAPEGGMYRDAE